MSIQNIHNKTSAMAHPDNVLLILTCTVHINPYKHFLFQKNPAERLELYLKSIKQWLEKTNFKICVVENSGYTFPELSEYMEKYGSRFEIITFNEMALPPELKHLMYNSSKGASEMYSIIHAHQHTKFKNSINFVIKITGRYYVPLFYEHLVSIDFKNRCRNVHIHHNENSIIGLRQANCERCEIIGISTLFFNCLFYLNLSDDNGGFYPHVETIY
jgi:hypothetical protein